MKPAGPKKKMKRGDPRNPQDSFPDTTPPPQKHQSRIQSRWRQRLRGRRGSEPGAPGLRDQSGGPAAFTLGGPGLHRHVNSELRPRRRGQAWRAARELAAASRAAGPGGPVRLRPPGEPREARAAAPPPPRWRQGEAPGRRTRLRTWRTAVCAGEAAGSGSHFQRPPGLRRDRFGRRCRAGDVYRSASGSVLGRTPRLPGRSLRRLPNRPSGFCLVQSPGGQRRRRPHLRTPPTEPDAARHCSENAEAPARPPAEPRPSAAGAGRPRLTANLRLGGPTGRDRISIGWAVVWGVARGGRAGSERSGWSARVAGPASPRSAVGRGLGGRGSGGRSRGGGPARARTGRERESKKGETMTRRNSLETRAGTTRLVPPRPELVKH